MEKKTLNRLFLYLLTSVLLFATTSRIMAQESKPTIAHRSIVAVKTTQKIKIDGDPSDIAWQTAAVADSFIERRPTPYRKPDYPTEMRILYDDEAIYVCAHVFDNPDSIQRQIGQRDDVDANADFVAVMLDTYHDRQNGFRFSVSAAGVQHDAKVGQFDFGNGNSGDQDFSWDAVWESAVSTVKDGWIAEIKIPYSALRFPKKPVQDWGMEFIRNNKRKGAADLWQMVDPLAAGFVNQWGDLTALKDIKPPLRLNLSPYFAASYARNPTGEKDASGKETYNNASSISGGLDVKYGINESFTLDATLIPNFGQVQSDNQVLNLSPFEVRYEERRPFFTEGTELFNKGGIFYSRRVGGTPEGYYDVESDLKRNESIVSNPAETQLFNASKLSGRTNSKLGIGFFNAVAAPMYATIRNDSTGTTRQFQTSPLTNYNVSVLQQPIKYNGEISLINALTLRNGSGRDANVTALLTRFRDKKNDYELSVQGKMSQIFYNDPTVANSLGYVANWGFGKISGNWNWGAGQELQTDRWNPDDLGIFNGNNYIGSNVNVQYNQTQPNKHFLQANYWFNINHTQQYRPFRYQDFNFNSGFWVKLKNQSSVNWWWNLAPHYTYDYFEPRYEGKQFQLPANFNSGVNLNSDQRKRFTWYGYLGFEFKDQPNYQRYSFIFQPAYRFNNKLNVSWNIFYGFAKNQLGYANSMDENDIIFGRRNRQTLENTVGINYVFSPKSNVTFRCRHYWSRAEYQQFYKLQDDGTLSERDWSNNENRNYNTFNIDAVYTWQFAPGSFVNLIWKNNISKREAGSEVLSQENFSDNIARTLSIPHNNSLTLKVIYFLDYRQLTKINFGHRSTSAAM